MTLLWVTLLLLHQGYSLVPVVTVQLDESVTFTCTFTEKFHTSTWLHWYKQTAGENLKLITMLRGNTNPTYGPGISASRFSTSFHSNVSTLTILRTSKEDEGMYHCAYMDWTKSTWSGTYLSIRGNTVRTSQYTVVQQTTGSDPADLETLQCSVLSDPEDESCSRGLSMFWFRSDKSTPDFLYTDGSRPANCDEARDTERRCSYDFSKKISSSDDGTYYCAVAACGQILFGNGTNLKNDETPSSDFLLLMVTIICLAVSVTVNIVFISYRFKKSAFEKSKEDCAQPWLRVTQLKKKQFKPGKNTCSENEKTDSETLQCSVLSASEDETCSGGSSVFWFRARSENSYPDMIYTDGYRPPNCDETSDTQRRCRYDLSKKISSSDDGTYYCAVATCGQILFGKGKKEVDAKGLNVKGPLDGADPSDNGLGLLELVEVGDRRKVRSSRHSNTFSRNSIILGESTSPGSRANLP
ncbi:uncharacterized protein LOC119408654 [Nematolebias whitei]|uniref:uncharacterized protein LOC119408654 n=1 Tax=Nematolebias whitei TaxID=451745 RepID=UPI00189A7C64|nr:uncharacterized protein LOC119408654 [Nematolebias whitei]